MSIEVIGTIWICQDCMLHCANGECGGCYEGHDEEPMNRIPDPSHTAMGMASDEHAEDCKTHILGGPPVGYECECETNTFSTSQCDGCGSYLHGERHAATLFSA